MGWGVRHTGVEKSCLKLQDRGRGQWDRFLGTLVVQSCAYGLGGLKRHMSLEKNYKISFSPNKVLLPPLFPPLEMYYRF